MSLPDRSRTNLKPSDLAFLILCPLYLVILEFLLKIKPAYFLENHLVENLQAATLLLAAIIALACAFKTDWRPYRWLYLLIGLFALFVFLEELDYGQQIFHFQSPSGFVKQAYQSEFSLHHLFFGIVDAPVYLGIFGFSVWVLISRKFQWQVRLLNYFPRITNFKYWYLIAFCLYDCLAIVMVFLYPMASMGFSQATVQYHYSAFPNLAQMEIVEAIAYFTLLLMLLFKPEEL